MYQNGELVIFRGWHMASWNYCCPNMACLGIQDRTKTDKVHQTFLFLF